jgi:hypothetical protein
MNSDVYIFFNTPGVKEKGNPMPPEVAKELMKWLKGYNNTKDSKETGKVIAKANYSGHLSRILSVVANNRWVIPENAVKYGMKDFINSDDYKLKAAEDLNSIPPVEPTDKEVESFMMAVTAASIKAFLWINEVFKETGEILKDVDVKYLGGAAQYISIKFSNGKETVVNLLTTFWGKVKDSFDDIKERIIKAVKDFRKEEVVV